jgi:hypothetical protein
MFYYIARIPYFFGVKSHYIQLIPYKNQNNVLQIHIKKFFDAKNNKLNNISDMNDIDLD